MHSFPGTLTVLFVGHQQQFSQYEVRSFYYCVSNHCSLLFNCFSYRFQKLSALLAILSEARESRSKALSLHLILAALWLIIVMYMTSIGEQNSRSISGIEFLSFEHAGLSCKRPFCFRTVHWQSVADQLQSRTEWECPGDQPDNTIENAVELFVPGYLWNNVNPLHRHAFYEIGLIRAGSTQHFGDLTGILTRGDVVVVTPKGVHGYDQCQNLVVTNIYLQPTWFYSELRLLRSEVGLVQQLLGDSLFPSAACSGTHIFRTAEEETEAWENELLQIEREARKARPSLAFYTGCFLKILAIISNAFVRKGCCVVPLRREIWVFAEAVENVIDQNGSFDIANLAQGIVNMNPLYFSHIFKEATGLTPTAYYQERRAHRAAHLLATTNLSCTQIAFELGYADGHHLSRIFRRVMGKSPKAYRLDAQNLA